jgi:hypothetical protein
MWQVEFSSTKFAPYLPEKCQGNPGVYGFELALWLSQELAKLGIVTSYPLGEDWGWFIEHIQNGTEIMIGCSSLAGEGEGYTGKPIAWSIFIRPQLSIKQRLKGASPEPAIRGLAQAITAVLAAESISVTPC